MEHGKSFDKPTLYLPSGLEGGGFLIVPLEGLQVTVEYTAAKVELMLALNRTLLADQHLDPRARGWRSPEQIAALLSYPLSEESLRRAVSRINVAFQAEAQQLAPHTKPPHPITTRRNMGMRLTWPLAIKFPGTDLGEAVLR